MPEEVDGPPQDASPEVPVQQTEEVQELVPAGGAVRAADKIGFVRSPAQIGQKDDPLRIREEHGEEPTRIADKDEAEEVAHEGNRDRSAIAFYKAKRVDANAYLSREIDIDELDGRESERYKVYKNSNLDVDRIAQGGQLDALMREADERAERRERFAQILHRNPDAQEAGYDVDQLISLEDSIPKFEERAHNTKTVIDVVEKSVADGKFNPFKMGELISGDRSRRAELNVAFREGIVDRARVDALREGFDDKTMTVEQINQSFVAKLKAELVVYQDMVQTRRQTLDRLAKNAFPDEQASETLPSDTSSSEPPPGTGSLG